MSLVWSQKLTSRWISVKSCLWCLIALNIMSNERRTRLINELSRFIAVLITSPLVYRPAAEVNSSYPACIWIGLTQEVAKTIETDKNTSRHTQFSKRAAKMIEVASVRFAQTQTTAISAGPKTNVVLQGRILWRGKRPNMLCVPMDFNPLRCLLEW